MILFEITPITEFTKVVKLLLSDSPRYLSQSLLRTISLGMLVLLVLLPSRPAEKPLDRRPSIEALAGGLLMSMWRGFQLGDLSDFNPVTEINQGANSIFFFFFWRPLKASLRAPSFHISLFFCWIPLKTMLRIVDTRIALVAPTDAQFFSEIPFEATLRRGSV